VNEDSDLTKCCKCRQLLTDPTTLPCLDSLCAKCFREVCDAYRDNAEGVAKCPRCGDQFPTNDSEALPDAGFIDTLVALKKIAGQNLDDDNCDICKQLAANSEPVAAAEYYCIQCRQRMCALCSGPHRVFSTTKNHDIVGLGLESAKKVLHMIKSFVPGCSNHKDAHSIVHCYQCSKTLCSQCLNLHGGHELEVLTEDTHSKLTNVVKSLADYLHQQFDECKEKSGRVRKLLLDRRNGVELAEQEIRDKADEMISLIQQQRDELLHGLHSRNDQTIRSLETAAGSLSSGLVAKKQVLQFAEELLNKGSVEDLLLNYRMLSTRVTKLHQLSDGSSQLDSNVCSDVSPASLIQDLCASLESQSKFSFSCLLVWLHGTDIYTHP